VRAIKGATSFSSQENNFFTSVFGLSATPNNEFKCLVEVTIKIFTLYVMTRRGVEENTMMGHAWCRK
jgi:hypothetical protein